MTTSRRGRLAKQLCSFMLSSCQPPPPPPPCFSSLFSMAAAHWAWRMSPGVTVPQLAAPATVPCINVRHSTDVTLPAAPAYHRLPQ